MTQHCPLAGAIAKRAMEYRFARGLAFDQPCDIYDLISQEGIALQFVDVPSLEGMYLAEPETQRICVCAHRPVGRQCYTAAHELGHHILGHGTQLDGVMDDLGQVRSLVPEEKAADMFARCVLMPPRAVRAAFRLRGFDLNALGPVEVYRVSCWLGVGYATLLNQMALSLGMLKPSDHRRLLTATPKKIKAEFRTAVSDRDVWPIDRFWANRRLHAQVGDSIIGLQTGCGAEPLAEAGTGAYLAASVGESKFPIVGGGSVRISVSRAAFVGFYEYRYLQE